MIIITSKTLIIAAFTLAVLASMTNFVFGQHYTTDYIQEILVQDNLSESKIIYDYIDYVEDYVIKGAWTKDEIDYWIDYSSIPAYLSSQGFKQITKRAFNEWSRVSTLRFSEVKEQNKADIVISFEIGDHGPYHKAFDGKGGTLAHAVPPNQDFQRYLHIDASEDWCLDCISTVEYNLFGVLLHEVGHSAVGLGHSTDPAAIMNPYYSPNRTSLGFDDINGIIHSYGSIEKPKKEYTQSSKISFNPF